MNNNDHLFGPADPDLLNSMFGPPDERVLGHPDDVLHGFHGNLSNEED